MGIDDEMSNVTKSRAQIENYTGDGQNAFILVLRDPPDTGDVPDCLKECPMIIFFITCSSSGW